MSTYLRDPTVRLNYNDAADLNGVEAITAQFWVSVFEKCVRSNFNLYWAPEQPPQQGDRRRVDIKVYCRKEMERDVLLFIEFKRANTTPAGQREAFIQVTNYGKAYIDSVYHRGINAVDCMVCYGTKATIWNLSRCRSGRWRHPRFNELEDGFFDHKTGYRKITELCQRLKRNAK